MSLGSLAWSGTLISPSSLSPHLSFNPLGMVEALMGALDHAATLQGGEIVKVSSILLRGR